MMNDVFNAYIVLNQNYPERLEALRKHFDEEQQAVANGLKGVAGMMKYLTFLDEELKQEFLDDNLLYDLGDLFFQNVTLLQNLSSAREVAKFYLYDLPDTQRTQLLNIGRAKDEKQA